ncbi:MULTISPECIES: hypothetical protein [unclassified Moorena]|uniref:hypothetical protein n=1 Tax=unclassified Moorena TaxID=2683338 RepID=UPI0013C5FEC0|nr:MULTISPECIES: hypothetical protein [unclassified Moorena]NES45820.1 hypothetical protein [Moorena sp. SIO2C4]
MLYIYNRNDYILVCQGFLDFCLRGNVKKCGRKLSAISYQLSAISYQLSAISFQLSAFSFQLSAFSF